MLISKTVAYWLKYLAVHDNIKYLYMRPQFVFK